MNGGGGVKTFDKWRELREKVLRNGRVGDCNCLESNVTKKRQQKAMDLLFMERKLEYIIEGELLSEMIKTRKNKHQPKTWNTRSAKRRILVSLFLQFLNVWRSIGFNLILLGNITCNGCHRKTHIKRHDRWPLLSSFVSLFFLGSPFF